MGLPTAEIQTALIAKLRGDATLTALLASSTAIYDAGGVPTNQAFPYIEAFPITSQSGTGLVFGTDAVDTWIQISIYTQYAGFAAARTIAKRVYVLNQQQSLTLTGGFNNFFTLFEREQEVPEPDGITQMIAQRYHLMIQG